MDSDDSDFYGNDEAVTDLEQRVQDFNVDQWWEQRNIERKTVPLSHAAIKQENPGSYAHRHNPYDGIPSAWQLHESVDSFLKRLPPATTDAGPDLRWIYICNPWIPRKHKSEATSQQSKGNEDEAPEEDGSKLFTAVEGAMERLELLEDFVQGATELCKNSATVSRDINQAKRLATQNILDLAHACKIRPGKWMVFCDPLAVNDLWEVVAKATARNELGIAAKVAPRNGENPQKERIICIYTTDFKDKHDVGRVLKRLRELRLVESRGKALYYKPDIFTYMGIASGNKWGLRASIYSSNDKFPSEYLGC